MIITWNINTHTFLKILVISLPSNLRPGYEKKTKKNNFHTYFRICSSSPISLPPNGPQGILCNQHPITWNKTNIWKLFYLCDPNVRISIPYIFPQKIDVFKYKPSVIWENNVWKIHLLILGNERLLQSSLYYSTSHVPHRDIGNFPSYFSYLTPACFSQKIIATPYKFSWHRLVSQHRLVSHGIDWYHILVWQLHVQS